VLLFSWSEQQRLGRHYYYCFDGGDMLVLLSVDVVGEPSSDAAVAPEGYETERTS
jgi:hypothetical protein